jgi:hypothetical protein
MLWFFFLLFSLILDWVELVRKPLAVPITSCRSFTWRLLHILLLLLRRSVPCWAHLSNCQPNSWNTPSYVAASDYITLYYSRNPLQCSEEHARTHVTLHTRAIDSSLLSILFSIIFHDGRWLCQTFRLTHRHRILVTVFSINQKCNQYFGINQRIFKIKNWRI